MLQILRRPLHSQNEEKIVTVATPVVSLLVSSFCDRGSLLPHIRDSLFPSVQPPVTCPCFHPATPASPLSPPPAHAAPLRACLLRTLLLSESASCASPPAAISNTPATSAPAAELKQHVRRAAVQPPPSAASSTSLWDSDGPPPPTSTRRWETAAARLVLVAEEEACEGESRARGRGGNQGGGGCRHWPLTRPPPLRRRQSRRASCRRARRADPAYGRGYLASTPLDSSGEASCRIGHGCRNWLDLWFVLNIMCRL
jgi:hypothetical protein